jgi:hypothetical protein
MGGAKSRMDGVKSRMMWIALSAGAVLIVVAVLGVSLAGNDARAGAANNPAASRPAAATPSLKSCGTWSEPGSAAATAVVSNRTIRNCVRVGTNWVLTTVGGAVGSANVGVLRCGGNASCAEGVRNPAAYAHWQWFQPAGVTGGATILGINGMTLILDVGGQQLSFSLANDRFSPETEN